MSCNWTAADVLKVTPSDPHVGPLRVARKSTSFAGLVVNVGSDGSWGIVEAPAAPEEATRATVVQVAMTAAAQRVAGRHAAAELTTRADNRRKHSAALPIPPMSRTST